MMTGRARGWLVAGGWVGLAACAKTPEARTVTTLPAASASAGSNVAPVASVAPVVDGVERMEALSGRLRLWVPPGTRNTARVQSIMSAPESSEDETRLMFDDGPARLVVMVRETFRLAGDDLERKLQEDIARASKEPGPALKLAPLASVSPAVRGFEVVPASVSTTRVANLVRGAYVVLSDRTVQTIDVYINPEAARDLPRYTALAERIVGSVVAGPRALDLRARTASLDLMSSSHELRVTLPAGFLVTKKEGHDFVVHHLRRLAPYGEAGAFVGVYAGNHPSPQHEQMEASAGTQTVAGKLLGQPVSWSAWTTGEPGGPTTSWLEVIHPLPASAGGPRLLHVWTAAAEAASLDEMRKVAGSIQVAAR